MRGQRSVGAPIHYDQEQIPDPDAPYYGVPPTVGTG